MRGVAGAVSEPPIFVHLLRVHLSCHDDRLANILYYLGLL
ncbi:hypothetical protein PaecuDRAFT_4421 [Paenibacillus curdlanolyticus YK9]|uniref:Uncharacterized protein n=1 Tax=Paenibacillus curdlanolyticus YK9 TaxID=717606 RepID=E0IFI0_9BACL|nr:hypothetical protein PaecuDRAFT_4421 [Paenibacillus curdlanolyticus YK9]